MGFACIYTEKYDADEKTPRIYDWLTGGRQWVRAGEPVPGF